MSQSVSESLALRMLTIGSEDELLARIRKILDSPMTDATKVALCRAAFLKRESEREHDEVR